MTTRRLAAILAADVVGFSSMMEKDEEGTLARVKALQRDVIEPRVRERGGRLVKTTGDGFLCEFGSPVEAVRCALEVQDATNANGEPGPLLRMGINLGDIIIEQDGDIYGDGVNVAARLEQLADPGGICISDEVHRHVEGKIDRPFQDRGEQQVKNLARPVRVFSLLDGVERKPLPLPQKPSIAVLPFENLSGQAEETYLSDGITEDIITGLARFRSLFVIARNSSFAFRDKAADVAGVGRQLGVSYLVEGSVRRIASRIRITAKLIDAATAAHIWAGRYDRELDDVFAVQDEVAQMIVSTLFGTIEHTKLEQAFRKPTESMVAYDFLLRGLAHFRGYAEEDNRRACEMFEKAVALDPRYALAHAYLAFVRVALDGFASASADVLNAAFGMAAHAVDLDPHESRCHRMLGMICIYRRDYDAAERHLRRALDLNPNDADGKSQMGYLLALRGRPEEGLEWIDAAKRLNPLHPSWYNFSVGIALYSLARYEEAAKAFQRLPNFGPWARARLAACLAQTGQTAEARAEAAAVLEKRPDFSIEQFLARDVLLERVEDREQLRQGLTRAGFAY